jgi:predicted transglutaminase-like cysteine proteinase
MRRDLHPFVISHRYSAKVHSVMRRARQRVSGGYMGRTSARLLIALAGLSAGLLAFGIDKRGEALVLPPYAASAFLPWQDGWYLLGTQERRLGDLKFELAAGRREALTAPLGNTSQRAFALLASALAGESTLTRLDRVNRTINSLPYVNDARTYAQADYWAAPDSFLIHGGDCEDYAIAKFHALKAVGFSPDDLRIVLVHDVALNRAHAVLAVRLDDHVYVLDNQSGDLLESTAVAVRYRPLYSFNFSGVWRHQGARQKLHAITTAG